MQVESRQKAINETPRQVMWKDHPNWIPGMDQRKYCKTKKRTGITYSWNPEWASLSKLMDNASKNEQNPKVMGNSLEAKRCKQASLKRLVFPHCNLQSESWRDTHTHTHTRGNKHHRDINNSIWKDYSEGLFQAVSPVLSVNIYYLAMEICVIYHLWEQTRV